MIDLNRLDPHFKPFLDQLNAMKPNPPGSESVAQGRRDYLTFALYQAGWPLEMARVEDKQIPSDEPGVTLPLRLYTPALQTLLPALIYFHGGGWQRGDIATHDSICRHLAHFSGCIVVSVQWRLSPEHPFPAGLNDALTAYKWVILHGRKFNIDSSCVAVGGDSAGGNIAAALTLMLRDLPLQKPVFQLLLYPALDLSCSQQSYVDFAEGFFLTTQRVKYYVSQYVRPPEDINNPLCSPLKAVHLANLPPAHLITCGFDPLHDEGEAYAKRLQESGVPTTYHCYESFIHAALHMNDTVPAVLLALQDIGKALKKGLER